MDMISEHCREPVTSKDAEQWFESTKELRAKDERERAARIMRFSGKVAA